MKALKILVCSIFVLCCGAIFTACRENKNFNIEKIDISPINEFVYDGNYHGVEITYGNVDVEVEYALKSDKDDFEDIDELNLVDVGSYEMYFKLSADGYNDYISQGTITLNIIPKTINVQLDEDFTYIKSQNLGLNIGYESLGVVGNDQLGLSFRFKNIEDTNELVLGQSYDIEHYVANNNYIVNLTNKYKVVVKDIAEITDGANNTTYFNNLQDAIDNAQDGQTIKLNDNVFINKKLDVNKRIIIDGQNKYSITARSSFQSEMFANKTLVTMFLLDNNNAHLTLKDVEIVGSQSARAVSAFHGKVVVDNAIIKNGKKVDNFRSGGVFISNNASFEMKGGEIINNIANDTEYTRFCADLWIGANAVGSMIVIEDGIIGSVFVNSNSYSANNPGSFTMEGGKINNLYVEYDSGYGATFNYQGGKILTLMISVNNDGDEPYGKFEKIKPVAGTTYIGGKLEY